MSSQPVATSAASLFVAASTVAGPTPVMTTRGLPETVSGSASGNRPAARQSSPPVAGSRSSLACRSSPGNAVTVQVQSFSSSVSGGNVGRQSVSTAPLVRSTTAREAKACRMPSGGAAVSVSTASAALPRTRTPHQSPTS